MRKTVKQVLEEFEERTGSRVEVKLYDFGEGQPHFNVLSQVFSAADGSGRIQMLIPYGMSGEYGALILEKELRAIERGHQDRAASAEDISNTLRELIQASTAQEAPALAVCTLIIPEKAVPEGILVRSAALAWQSLVEQLTRDKWDEVFKLDPLLFEELVAGAFERSRLFDQVILTPGKGDKGRDIVAIKRGFSGFRVIGSVKRYAPGRAITRAQVDELIGTLYRDPNASKGIFMTTSDFAPGVLSEPSFTAMMPNRLELINGAELQKWLREVSTKEDTRS